MASASKILNKLDEVKAGGTRGITMDFVTLFQGIGLEHNVQLIFSMLLLPCGKEEEDQRNKFMKRISVNLTETRLVSKMWETAVTRLVIDTTMFSKFYLQRCRDLFNG